MNNFFERQQQARTLSTRLLILFLLAVLAIIAALSLLVMLLLGDLPVDSRGGAHGLLAPETLAANAGLLVVTALAGGALIGLASLFRVAGLRGGGGKVAVELGGRRVDPETADPLQRRLLNVVEEMALASGVPAPEVYVLDQEPGINAFAAGYGPADAAVAVTRGALDSLSRSELQGVIAHEFSHILNGDMRLNIRLMGLLFGILVLAIAGRRVLRSAYLFGGRRNRNAGAVLAIAVGLVAIGYIGLFFGRWIKAVVSRQREYLADASAVQFTREPGGIAGALKKIGASQYGSKLIGADGEEVSHMLFGAGVAARLFATHPPLVERIRALEPGFEPEAFKHIAAAMLRERQRDLAACEPAHPTGARRQPAGFDAASIIEHIGRPEWQTLLAAAALAETLPEPLVQAARHQEWALATVLLLLLDDDESIRERQFASIRELLGEQVAQQVAELHRHSGRPAAESKLPLLELALPALKNHSRQELREWLHAIRALSLADSEITPFEFALLQVVAVYLEDNLQPGSRPEHGRKHLRQRRAAALASMAALAWFGHGRSPDQARPALAAGLEACGLEGAEPEGYWPDPGHWAADQQRALQALDQLAPRAKEQLVRAWLKVILHDRSATVAELELLRTYCAGIHVPVPPLAGSG